MKHLLVFLMLLMPLLVQAQADLISAKKGDITLSPVLHGSLVLEWRGRTIYVDPYGGAEAYLSYPKPDLIIITDIHGDHLDKKTLSSLNLKGAELIAPQAVMKQLGDSLDFRKKHALANGDQKKWKGISVQAIPMYNLPESAESRHPKGRGNGYVLNMGGKRIYIAGDTEAVPEMRQLKNIDVAFVPMNLPFTMDVEQAAEGVLAFKPAIVYPYHFRGAGGVLSDVQQFKAIVNMNNPAIDVRIRNWYPKN